MHSIKCKVFYNAVNSDEKNFGEYVVIKYIANITLVLNELHAIQQLIYST